MMKIITSLASCGMLAALTLALSAPVVAQAQNCPVTVLPATEVPVAPAQLSAAASDQAVALSWKPVAGADAYSVKRATLPSTYVDANTLVYVSIGEATGAAYKDTTAKVGTDYVYVVSAKNTAGESGNSQHSCSSPAPAGTVTTGVRPRVFMAMHGSQALSGGSATQDAQWAYVRTCLEGIYNNNANVVPDDQARMWRKINTRNLFGIINANGRATDPAPVFPPPDLSAVEKQNADIRLKRDAVVVYSLYSSLWDKITVDTLRSTLATYPNQDPSVPREAVWKDVFVGYALRNWVDPTATDGALSSPGAINALASAGGAMVECIGGLCGSGGTFGQGFIDMVQRTHANGKPVFLFASKSPKNAPQSGWFDEFKSEYQKVSDLGLWRADDVVMVINYQGSYPTLPMKNADGSAADTVTGMLYWALRQ